MDDLQIFVTGRYWTGVAGTLAIGPALFDLINHGDQEITIVAYRLTVSVKEVRQALEAALGRGCEVRLILDKSGEENPSETGFFGKLMQAFPNLTIWDFQDHSGDKFAALHAKMLIVDRKKAIVGSANFSRNGLIENHEIAFSIEGGSVSKLCKIIDELITGASLAGVLKRRLPS